MTDAFRTYRFGFDKALYAKKFKETLTAHGILKPADLNALFERAGITEYGYETVKSYFYPDRRLPPMPILAAVCRALKVSADSIAFSGSTPPPYPHPIGGSFEAGFTVENTFLTVFENEALRENGILWQEDLEVLESAIEALSDILARYHYLLAKYRFAALSGRELAEVMDFTDRYLVTEDGFFAPWDEVSERVKGFDSESFLESFYENYAIGLYSTPIHQLAKGLASALPDGMKKKLSALLPESKRG